MSESLRSQFRLPHWGWFLLATVLLVVGGVGLAVWLPWHRERQVIQKIESWRGSIIETTNGGPEWLRWLVGNQHMQVFDRVSAVDLNYNQITNAGMSEFRHLRSLTNLFIGGTQVDNSGLPHLRGLTTLKSLGLNDTGVTDAGLIYLSGCTNLESLSLERTAVTDAGLAQLSGLKNLRVLLLFGATVTDKGIEELKKALPDCEILH